MTIRPTRTSRALKRYVLAAAFAVVMASSLAVPAHAEDWRAHESRARDWHRHHPHYEPGVVYAPPPVVYMPPPSPGINFIIPLHIR